MQLKWFVNIKKLIAFVLGCFLACLSFASSAKTIDSYDEQAKKIGTIDLYRGFLWFAPQSKNSEWLEISTDYPFNKIWVKFQDLSNGNDPVYLVVIMATDGAKLYTFRFLEPNNLTSLQRSLFTEVTKERRSQFLGPAFELFFNHLARYANQIFVILAALPPPAIFPNESLIKTNNPKDGIFPPDQLFPPLKK